MEVSETVVKIIAEQAILDPSDVTLDSTLTDLGIDSLGLVESIFALEERFDITIPFNVNQTESTDFNISTVATIIAAIEQLITEQSS